MPGKALPGRPEMDRLDEVAVRDVGLPVVAMMEHAGHHLAWAVREVGDGPFLVLAGKGNNGGGGLAAARHLVNAGEAVGVLLAARPKEATEAFRVQLRVLDAMGLPITRLKEGIGVDEAMALALEGDEAGTLVDALLGYHADGAPRPPLDRLVEAANAAGSDGAARVSLDLPTGLDATTGEAPGRVVRADATVTLAAVKRGLTLGDGPSVAGRVCLCDLGIPAVAYEKANLKRPTFGPAGRRWL